METPVLTFAVLSDIHLTGWLEETHDSLSRALLDLLEINREMDAVIFNGDLTDTGHNEGYIEFFTILYRMHLRAKAHYNMGNHEYFKSYYDQERKWNFDAFPNDELEEASRRRYLSFTGQPNLYYEKEINGYPFIFLASEVFRQTDPHLWNDAWLSDEQLNWLEEKMSVAGRSGKPIFVFLHQPLPYTVADKYELGQYRGVVQHERLYEILERYPQVFLFSGHTHWGIEDARSFVDKKIVMVNSGAVRPPEKSSSEGLYIEVFPSGVRIRGRDFLHARWLTEFMVQE